MSNTNDAASKVVAFAAVVESARQASGQGLPLPTSVLNALLEDPARILLGSDHDSASAYEQVDLLWKSLAPFPVPISIDCRENISHEVSQTFVRHLPLDRYRCYRVHRFLLPVLDFWSRLIISALEHEHAAHPDDSMFVSNVGGYHSAQDLFVSTRYAGAENLARCIASCVQRAAIADAAEFSETGETAPPSPCSNALEAECGGWANVSRKGALNMLHTHADAALATVFYAQVPPGCGGSLLLRLTPGNGKGFSEPDEEKHVPRMWPASVGSDPCGIGPASEQQQQQQQQQYEKHHVCQDCGCKCADTHRCATVRFAEVPPIQRSLLLFPGWLSHSVLPHFSEEPRISFASNWQLPCAEEDPFAEMRLNA